MAQDIELLNALYPQVPAILLPKSGGGQALFTDVSPTTAAASDVAQGKKFFLADGSEATGTASGGTSRTLIGTFKGTTSGALDVSIPYSGSGYPIAISIFPSEGGRNAHTGSFTSLVAYRATVFYAASKCETDTQPLYTSDTDSENLAVVLVRYKNSETDPAVDGSSSSSGQPVYTGGNAKNGTRTMVSMKDRTTMSVFIRSSSYGFAQNIEYTYIVTYSS